jgi:hypothetical protein
MDLGWHPRALHVSEGKAGLAFARVAGIRAGAGEILVFVDDDNVLDAGYLATANELFLRDRALGVAGGRIEPAFEERAPAWLRHYQAYLALGQAGKRPYRLRGMRDWGKLPCGAGLCVRRRVALLYADRVRADSWRATFGGRSGTMFRGEDIDIGLVALSEGYGALLDPALRLTHLIRRERLSLSYLESLLEGSVYSSTELALAWGLPRKPMALRRVLSRMRRLADGMWDLRLLARLERCVDRGESRAMREFAERTREGGL